VVRVAAWRVLTCGSMRWGCWSRCPARGFQQFLPCLAPRLHLGTACCTAGSGPGPPAVQTIIMHSILNLSLHSRTSGCKLFALQRNVVEKGAGVLAADCAPSWVMQGRWSSSGVGATTRRVQHTQGATEGLPTINPSSPRPQAIHAGLFLQRAAHGRPLVAHQACGKVRPLAVIKTC